MGDLLPSVDWGQIGAGVVAAGTLGTAAFGLVESLGKALAFSRADKVPAKSGEREAKGGERKIEGDERKIKYWGLPYVGLHIVDESIRPFHDALECAYGSGFLEIISQQYRAGRSSGTAPDTIRQGIRLGLPFLDEARAVKVISAVWKLPEGNAQILALALRPTSVTSSASEPDGVDPAALAGRFSTALDARINAAFSLAEERYESCAKTLAGIAAVMLAIVFKISLPDEAISWPLAVCVGLVAVPLAPVAKDISTSLQNALTAFKSISSKV